MRVKINPFHIQLRGLNTSSYLPKALRYSLEKGAPIDIHPEIEDALATNKPVVALESTIITHGMPQPTNLHTAQSVERIVRSTGSIPATIGMLRGRIKIGLNPSELEYLADTKSNPSVVKLSRRDIAPAIAQKRDGGTTCSGTLIFAALAGIKVFATGGLGGVHRGGENSMDVSADLQELTRCPVGLVSAGVKSILDIGRTLEYLETLGVPVMSYAKTDDFPAFYTAQSGFKAPWRVNDPETAAKILLAHWQLGMTNGALFGVPIPEQYESIGQELQKAVEVALDEAEQNGVNRRGKEATPWLLKRVGELTKGTSLDSNIALIENTALVGGQIAKEYARLSIGQESQEKTYAYTPRTATASQSHPPTVEANNIKPAAKLVIVGSAAVDISAKAAPVTPGGSDALGMQSTSPGEVAMTLGGVGRNIAEAAHRRLISYSEKLNETASALLVSPIGDDSFGRVISNHMDGMGMRTDGLVVRAEGARSAVCNMVLDSGGNLIGGVADMDIIQSLKGDQVVRLLERTEAKTVALDGNLSPDTLKDVVKYCIAKKIDTLFEPTSIIKSTRILPAVASSLNSVQGRSPVTYATPNLLELKHMYQACRSDPLDLTSHSVWWQVIDDFGLSSQFRMELEQLARRNVSDEDASKGKLSFLLDDGIAQMAVNLLPFFQNLVIKCGARGLLAVMRISGDQARDSQWAHELTNPHKRCVVAHGKSSKEIVVLQHFVPAQIPEDSIVNVTGAGDSLVGSILASLLQQPGLFANPSNLSEAMNVAQQAAVLTLQSQYAVSPELSIKSPLAIL